MGDYDGSIRIKTDIDTKDAKAQLSEIDRSIAQTAQKLNDAQKSLSKMSSGDKSAEYKKLEDELSKVTAKYDKIAENEHRFLSTGGKEKSSAYQRYEYDLDMLESKQDEIIAKMREMEAAGKASSDFDISTAENEIKNLSAELDELILKRNELLQAAGEDTSAANVQKTGDVSTAAAKTGEDIAGEGNAARQAAGNMDALANSKNNAKTANENLGESAGETSGEIDKESKSASLLSKAYQKMSGLAKGALKKVANSLLGLGKSSDKSGVSMDKLFKNILRYGFGIRSLFVLFNKLRSALKEGLSNLAQFNNGVNPTNTALSSLKSALTQLKNSFATAFAPIIQVVAPILTTFINLISKAVTAVGMLIATLTGAKTFTKATKVQENYAGSLSDTASAAKAANKQLSGLDKLNNLTSNDGSGGGGGSDGGVNPNDMFETVDIPSKFQDIADMLKTAWENADFTEIGGIIGEKLKTALESIDYTKMNDAAQRVAKSLGTLINGFVETSGLGETIGSTVGNLLNVGMAGLQTFLDTTKWYNVGQFIGDTLNGFVDSFDFSALGELVASKINAKMSVLEGFLDTARWFDAGTKIGDTINGFVERFDWAQIGRTISKSLNSIMETADGFLTNVDWTKLGTGVMTSIGSMFETFDYARAAQTITHAIAVGLDLITGLIQGVDWASLPGKIIEKIAEFLGGADWVSLASSVGNLAGALMRALFDFGAALADVFKDVAKTIKDYFVEKIKAAGWDKDNDIIENGKAIVEGIFNGIVDAIKGVGTWIKKNLLDPFIKGFKNAFGIHSPSTVMATQGKQLVAGLKEGIKAKWDAFKDWFAKKKDAIVEVFKNIKDKFLEKGKAIIAGIKSGITDKWEDFKSYWTAKKDAVVDTFKNIKDKFLEKGSAIISGIKSGISNKWADFYTYWAGKKTAIVDKFKDIKDKFSAKGQSIISGIKSGISTNWSGFKTWIKGKKEALVDTFKNIKESMEKVGKNFVSGIIDGIKAKWDSLKSWVGKVTDKLTGTSSSSASSASTTSSSSSAMRSVRMVDTSSIPGYATGQVIPTNMRRHLAWLGDNKQETEVVSPLSTMTQAMVDALNQSGIGGTSSGDIVIQIDGREVFRATQKQAQKYYNKTGKGAFAQ
jgi:hypothetical protein